MAIVMICAGCNRNDPQDNTSGDLRYDKMSFITFPSGQEAAIENVLGLSSDSLLDIKNIKRILVERNYYIYPPEQTPKILVCSNKATRGSVHHVISASILGIYDSQSQKVSFGFDLAGELICADVLKPKVGS